MQAYLYHERRQHYPCDMFYFFHQVRYNINVPYFLLIIGFVLLVKGADLLVEGASSIAARLKVSNLVIGLTIVALGTSAPELFVNIVSSIRGYAGIAIGNILGSNIANICLILGICALIRPLTIQKETVWKGIPFVLLATLVLGFLANDRFIDSRNASVLSRIDGLILLSFFAVFLYYSFSIAKKTDEDDMLSLPRYGRAKSLLFIVLGLVCLSVGGKWIVEGAVHLALNFGMSESLVGLTIVAIGTALPELATSIVAVYKGNFGLAIGNIIGSNIFNVFFVLGISTLIRPIPFQAVNNTGIGMMILSGLLLFLFMFTGKRHSLNKWEGGFLLLSYAGYLFFLFFIQA